MLEIHPGRTKKSDKGGQALAQPALKWCKANELSVGDQERSQTFIWKALDFLKPNGIVGMLVSAGILFKKQQKSKTFRKQWLELITLQEVVNFTHVRQIFFRNSSGISPFIAVFFKNTPNKNPYHIFPYWSAKKTAIVNTLQSVILSKTDLNMTNQEEVKNNDFIWKVNWWGGHRDIALIQQFSYKTKLLNLYDENLSGRGFQKGNEKNLSNWLQNYKEFPTSYFKKYGDLNFEKLISPPNKVEHRGKNKDLYEGTRLFN